MIASLFTMFHSSCVIKVFRDVRKSIYDGLSTWYKKSRGGWVLEWPEQSVLSVCQTYWTKEVTEELKTRSSGLKTLYAKLLKQLKGLVGPVRGDLAFLNRLVPGDLIVIDVHNRDVVIHLSYLLLLTGTHLLLLKKSL
jgi:dynein heavy chain